MRSLISCPGNGLSIRLSALSVVVMLFMLMPVDLNSPRIDLFQTAGRFLIHTISHSLSLSVLTIVSLPATGSAENDGRTVKLGQNQLNAKQSILTNGLDASIDANGLCPNLRNQARRHGWILPDGMLLAGWGDRSFFFINTPYADHLSERVLRRLHRSGRQTESATSALIHCCQRIDWSAWMTTYFH